MHLFDTHRPTIAHRLAFLSGMVTIPQPQIWPLEDNPNLIEISMMLPIKGASGYMAKWFRAQINAEDLPTWMIRFRNDPEQTILETFNDDQGFTPNLDAKSHVEPKKSKEPTRALRVPPLLLDNL